MATPTTDAPHGYDPAGRPLSDKSKITAGLLQLFLGTLGIGRFYTGHTGMAIGQLLTCGGLGIWSFIDAILFFTSKDRTDAKGRILQG
ncbi:TM2 domain-containing protein [Streptomyces sp. NPDC001070]